jgi:hypothetical protein
MPTPPRTDKIRSRKIFFLDPIPANQSLLDADGGHLKWRCILEKCQALLRQKLCFCRVQHVASEAGGWSRLCVYWPFYLFGN